MDGIVNVLQYAVDGVAQQQQATANNLANADTPGYTAQDVDFETQPAAGTQLSVGRNGRCRRLGRSHRRRQRRKQRRHRHATRRWPEGDPPVPDHGRHAERPVPPHLGSGGRELLMSLFGSLDISGTGIDASQAWLNTTAGNIANMNDVVRHQSGRLRRADAGLRPRGRRWPGRVRASASSALQRATPPASSNSIPQSPGRRPGQGPGPRRATRLADGGHDPGADRLPGEHVLVRRRQDGVPVGSHTRDLTPVIPAIPPIQPLPAPPAVGSGGRRQRWRLLGFDHQCPRPGPAGPEHRVHRRGTGGRRTGQRDRRHDRRHAGVARHPGHRGAGQQGRRRVHRHHEHAVLRWPWYRALS